MRSREIVTRALCPATGPDAAGEVTARTDAALRAVVCGGDVSTWRWVRSAVAGLGDVPEAGLTEAEQATRAPVLLERVIAALGGSAVAVAGDPVLRGPLVEWAAVAAPRLLTVLTGHLDLAVNTITRLGDPGSAYQRGCLAELDTVDAVGVLALTELGGTNGADQQTLAVWDPREDGWRLRTPAPAACKFMPNVAAPGVAKTAVVTARAVVDGRDEGVLAFVLRLRGASGLAGGVRVAALPDKGFAAMDHAMIAFTDTAVPRDALLGGDWARMGADGRFRCDLDLRARFHRSVAGLGAGRADLAVAAVAAARGGLAMLHAHGRRRLTGGGVLLGDRAAVRSAMVSHLAATYAAGALATRARAAIAGTGDDRAGGLWAMLAKPLAADTAHRTLVWCRRRAGAQGCLRANWFVDWIGVVDAIGTAEGDGEVLRLAAGHHLRRTAGADAPTLSDRDESRWFHLLEARERWLANPDSPNRDVDGDLVAIELADATAERLAAEVLAQDARRCGDARAAAILANLAAVYALERVVERAHWHIATGLDTEFAGEVARELARRTAALTEDIPTLIAAFDIPPLAAPMLSPDYTTAWLDHVGWDPSQFTGGRAAAALGGAA